jgi:putative transposase
VALACAPPERYGRPITHWSSRELAAEVLKQGIVAQLSAGHLRKFLNTLRIQPHRSRYWLNAKVDPDKEAGSPISARFIAPPHRPRTRSSSPSTR